MHHDRAIFSVHRAFTRVCARHRDQDIRSDCHKLRTGKLAESLEELVPEYFEAVPTSEYDGKPMRYSSEEKKIYIKRKEPEVEIFEAYSVLTDMDITIEF